MTSDASPPREAFVWIWLPGKTAPVVAGRVHAEDDHFVFTYGRSYLAREDAIPVYAPELPLRTGAIVPEPPLEIANALRDASPDAWGRRVIAHRFAGGGGRAGDLFDLDELTFMLRSGSDRIGALDFQASPRDYVPRESDNETLDRLVDSADRVDRGLPLAPDLAEALQHGTAIGGARPKALIRDDDIKYVAKFSSSTDTYSVIKAEFLAMRLARAAALNVAPVKLVRAVNKDVLLIRRFDREPAEAGWRRLALVSALTLLGLDERMAAHASYEALADIVRARFTAPAETPEGALRAHDLQHSCRQYGRPCPEPRRLLGRRQSHAYAGLRYLPAIEDRARSLAGHANSRPRAAQPTSFFSRMNAPWPS